MKERGKRLVVGLVMVSVTLGLLFLSPGLSKADTWEAWQDLVGDTNLTSSTRYNWYSSLGVDSAGNVHISWDSYGQIYYTKLDNNGNTVVEDTRLTSGSRGGYPSLGVDSTGNVHIAWENRDIYYTKLDDNGNTVVEDTKLTSGNFGYYPSLGVDSAGNVHISWEYSNQIYYTKLDNNGNTVVEDTKLTSASSWRGYPSLRVDSSGNVHIAWQDNRDGNRNIYYTKLDNNGNTVVDDTRLTSGNSGYYPSLGVDSAGNVHIIWEDGDVYYTKLDNDGNTLIGETSLTYNSSAYEHDLGVDSSGNVHIAFWDQRNNADDIYYIKLDNNGNKMVEDTKLTHVGIGTCSPLTLGVDSAGDIHIAWEDYRGDNDGQIYYTKGTIVTCSDADGDGYAIEGGACGPIDCDDADPNTHPRAVELCNNKDNDCDGQVDDWCGLRWRDLVDDTRLSSTNDWSRYPSLGVDGSGNVHIAWWDRQSGNFEIYYTKLYSNGTTAVDDTQLTFVGSGTFPYARPSLGVDGSGNVHIAWQDYRDGNNGEIYYTKLDNNGNTLVDDTRLTSDNVRSQYPSLGMDSAGNVHIAWGDSRHGYNIEIYYTKLDNNGNTIVEDTRLTSEWGYSQNPTLGVDNAGNVHIAWRDRRDSSYKIYYTKLDNNGNTLVDDTRLNYGPDSDDPSLEVDNSGNVYITWTDYLDYDAEIYYTMLDNNGNTIVEDTRLSNSGEFSSVGVDSDGNVHIAWSDYRSGGSEIYYTMLDNTSNPIVADTRLTYSGESEYPSLAVDSDGNVHIAWEDGRDGNREIYYTKGTTVFCTDVDGDGYAIDGGACGPIDCNDSDSNVYPGAIELCDNKDNDCDGQVDDWCDVWWRDIVADTRLTYSSRCRYPSLGVDSSGNVHIAWWNPHYSNRAIYYTKLDDNGNTVVDDTRLTSEGSWRGYPSLGVDSSGNVHISWEYSNQVYYTKLDNNGNTVVDDTKLTSVSGSSYEPSLGVDNSGNIHIAWWDNRDGSYEIYYTKLDNNGNTVVDDTKLTSASSSSQSPNLGVDSSGNIHIAWEDSRDNNYGEIYYTKLDNNGNTVVDDTRLTSDNVRNQHPSLGVDSSGNIHIAWEDGRNGNYSEIYYTKLDNNGNTLVYDTGLTFASADNYAPSLGVDSLGNVHIAWEGYQDNNWWIYYTMLDNNGNTIVEDTRLSSERYESESPSLEVDSFGNVHIAWTGYPDGGWGEIFYTKGTPYVCTDTDADGYAIEGGVCGPIDCNDTDATVYPGAPEICDNQDNDCNGEVDDGVYLFGGFQPPINSDGSSVFNVGRTIPVKIIITDCSGESIPTATVEIELYRITEQGEEQIGLADNLFEYNAETGEYVYILKTKDYPVGTYKVYALPDDGSSYSVTFSLE